MRIACIASSGIPSNAAHSIQVVKMCSALAGQQDAVTLWVPGKKTTSWQEIANFYGVGNEFPIQWLQSRKLLRRMDFAISALTAARRWNADVIYTWMVQVAVMALWLGFPAVLEIHDRPTGRVGPLWLRQFSRMKGRQKRALLISHALRSVLSEEYNIRFADDVVRISPNGCDLDRYQDLPDPSKARQALGLADVFTAVYSGHFYAGRGMDVLFALARVFPRVQFLWVGGRPEHVEQLQQQLRGEGIQNVVLTGFVENIHLPLYQAAGDILLMPYGRSIAGSGGGNSADICSPMKMFDYLAAGRAIMTSDLPVIHEVLGLSNAVFCPPDDADAWVQAFGDLLNDPPRIERLGREARKDAAAYSWDQRAAHAMAGFPETPITR